jgi:hypothetical protein
MTFILYFLYLYSSLPPFTAVFMSARSRVDCWTFEDGTNTLSHNNGNQLPTYAVQHNRRANTSTTTQQKPQISPFSKVPTTGLSQKSGKLLASLPDFCDHIPTTHILGHLVYQMMLAVHTQTHTQVTFCCPFGLWHLLTISKKIDKWSKFVVILHSHNVDSIQKWQVCLIYQSWESGFTKSTFTYNSVYNIKEKKFHMTNTLMLTTEILSYSKNTSN